MSAAALLLAIAAESVYNNSISSGSSMCCPFILSGFVHLPTAGIKQSRSRGQTSLDITTRLFWSRTEKVFLQLDSSAQHVASFLLFSRTDRPSSSSVSDQLVSKLSRLPRPVQLQRSEGEYLLASLDILLINQESPLPNAYDSIRLLASQ